MSVQNTAGCLGLQIFNFFFTWANYSNYKWYGLEIDRSSKVVSLFWDTNDANARRNEQGLPFVMWNSEKTSPDSIHTLAEWREILKCLTYQRHLSSATHRHLGIIRTKFEGRKINLTSLFPTNQRKKINFQEQYIFRGKYGITLILSKVGQLPKYPFCQTGSYFIMTVIVPSSKLGKSNSSQHFKLSHATFAATKRLMLSASLFPVALWFYPPE